MLSALIGAVLTVVSATTARAGQTIPPELQGVQLDDHLGRTLPLDAAFTDESGEAVALAKYFDTGRPVVIVPVYYNCPSLCNFTLNGFVDVIKELEYVPGREFEIVTVSFAPGESPQLAAAKKTNYIRQYGTDEAANGWHWLVGEGPEIDRLMDALGFRYAFDPPSGEYRHSPAVYIATADGRISRMFTSIYFEPRDLRLALVEASEGEIGTLVDHFILYCTRFSPESGKYTWVAMTIMRIGGALTVMGIAGLIGTLLWRERRKVRLADLPTSEATPQQP